MRGPGSVARVVPAGPDMSGTSPDRVRHLGPTDAAQIDGRVHRVAVRTTAQRIVTVELLACGPVVVLRDLVVRVELDAVHLVAAVLAEPRDAFQARFTRLVAQVHGDVVGNEPRWRPRRDVGDVAWLQPVISGRRVLEVERRITAELGEQAVL